MKVTRKNLPKSQVELIIETGPEKFAKFRSKAVQKISQQVNIPGFRKGNIPEKIIIDNYGDAAIVAEAADIAIPELLTDALMQENVSPLTRPDVALESMEPFTFKATVTILPEVELGDWEKVAVAEKKVDVKKKEIDDVIEQLQGRFMERKPVERAAKNGDFVEIDFAGKTPDGVPLDGTQSKCHPVVLGDGMLLPDFEKNIIGMKKDEEKQFTITFPKDYQAKHLAGKDVVFDAKLLSVMEQIKPEVNEEFAEKVFGKKLDEKAMRAEIEGILKEKAADEARKERENELIEKWEKMAKVEMPEVLIEEELRNLVSVMQDRAQMSGIPWDQYLQNMKKSQEDFEKEMKPEAEKRAKQRLVLGKIIAVSGAELDDKEVEARAAAIHEEMHQHGHDHGDDHSTGKGSQVWQQASHILRVEKIFDRFLGEQKGIKA